jgi:hypothetical protein
MQNDLRWMINDFRFAIFSKGIGSETDGCAIENGPSSICDSNPDYSYDFIIKETGIAWIILRTTFQSRLFYFQTDTSGFWQGF